MKLSKSKPEGRPGGFRCPRCRSLIPPETAVEAFFCPVCGYPLRKTVFTVKWDVGDVFKVLILSLAASIPLIVVLAFSLHPLVERVGLAVPLFIVVSSFHLVLLGFTLHYVKKRGEEFSALGLRFPGFKPLALSMLVGLTLPLTSIAVDILVKPVLGSSPIQNELIQLARRPDIYPGLILFASLLAPIVEEIYFRGFSYQAFRKAWGFKRGILICSSFFAVLHMDPWAIPHTFIAGVILTYLYEKTGTIQSTILAHSINNLVAFLSYLLYTS